MTARNISWLTAMAFALPFGAGACGPPVSGLEVDDTELRRQDVTGGLSQHHDYCDSAQWRLIESLWNIGKVVVQRPEFADCVRAKSYLPCDNDPFPMTSAGSEQGEEYAIIASYSPNQLRVECRVSDEWSGRVTSGNVEEPYFEGKETLTLAKQMLDDYAHGWIGDAAFPAAVMWHEIMHTHGFRHGNDDDISERDEECGYPDGGWNYYTNSMPEIVESCVMTGFNEVVTEQYRRWFARNPTFGEKEEFYARLATGSLPTPDALRRAIDEVPPEWIELAAD